MLTRIRLFVLTVIGGSGLVTAQVGSIKGMVTGEKMEAIAFANVMIEGTRLGASADHNGEYTILNVPPAQYQLQATAVGFRKQTASVSVPAGGVVTQNFALVQDLLNLEGVVVTGSYTPKSKLESTVAISTLGPRELALANPRSTTEVLRYTPGFTRIESSGGEVNENISVRGILGVEYVMFMEDGLPVFPTMHTFFMNADNLFRLDENIQKVEVVRGGNSALFGSNTPGAIINFLNKTGGPDIGGSLKATTGTEGLARYDFNLNGPLGDEWQFNFGGFYRYDHGARDPGFPGIKGGQFKGSATRLLNKGYVRASVKFIDDRNQFILPLPFQNPSDPKYVPGFSNYGSMNTEEGNHIRVPIPTGELELPLDNGLRTNAYWLTADIGFNFREGWELQNTAQVMQNDQEWNAILPFDVKTASDWFASLGYAAGSTYKLFYTNVMDVNGNRRPFDKASNGGLGLVAPGGEWHIEKPLAAFQDQLQIRKAIGPHKVSLGLYFAQYTQTNRWYFTDILTDVRDNPHFLDLEVYVPVGPGTDTIQATKNGFRHFLSNYANGTGSTTIVSGVIGGEFQLSDRLRADVGIRYESDDFVQTSENTSSVDLDGDPTTPYDKEPWGNGSFRHFKRRMDDFAASLGLNYKLNDEVALYLQGSRAYKMPALDEFLNAQAEQQISLFEARRTWMAEGGVKYGSSRIAAAVTGFWGQILNNIGQGAEVDSASGNLVWKVRTFPDSRAYGVEVEVTAQPVEGLTFLGAGTFLGSQTVEPGGASLTAGGIPKAIGNISATYAHSGLAVKADWHYVGSRDIVDADYDATKKVFKKYNVVGALKAYSYVNLGVSYTFSGDALAVSADVLNAFQSLGFEEGNPRLVSTGGNSLFLARPVLPRRGVLTVRYQF